MGHRGATKSFRFSYNLLRQWILVLVTADLRCSVELMRGTAEFIALAEECHALQQLSQACARFKSRSLIGAERSKEIFRRSVSIVARVPNSPDSDFAVLRRAVHTVARFRAYDSYAEGFRDYAGLVSTSPRYAQARQQQGSVQGWAQGLQSGGYATDPDYAAKLSRAINTALRVQRAQG